MRLENVISHLAYSVDGRYLAASLGGENGVRIYASSDYREIYADKDYQDSSFWVSWQGNTGLVTSSYDGKIRLYQSDMNNWALANSFDTG